MLPADQDEPQRSPEARQLAERALVALLHELGETELEIVILGGLVPEVLTSGQHPPAPPHLGTADVDVLLVTRISTEKDHSAVEESLRRIGFEPEDGGWRWRGRIDGRPVKIEFLCDLETEREFAQVRPPGCRDLAAQNLRGTGWVAEDWEAQTLSSVLPDGSAVNVEARFARLGGYLLSKCVAARTRGATKDFYDLAYVLLHNRAGGPSEAAAAVQTGALSTAPAQLRNVLTEIGERYRTPNAVGPSAYAAESLLIEPEADEAGLRADAVAAVAEFLEALPGAGA